MLVNLAGGQREEGVIVDQITVGESEFAEAIALGEKGGNGAVTNEVALVQIDFEDIRAVLSECEDGVIAKLGTFV